MDLDRYKKYFDETGKRQKSNERIWYHKMYIILTSKWHTETRIENQLMISWSGCGEKRFLNFNGILPPWFSFNIKLNFTLL